jgi:hypothetical protein
MVYREIGCDNEDGWNWFRNVSICGILYQQYCRESVIYQSLTLAHKYSYVVKIINFENSVSLKNCIPVDEQCGKLGIASVQDSLSLNIDAILYNRGSLNEIYPFLQLLVPCITNNKNITH